MSEQGSRFNQAVAAVRSETQTAPTATTRPAAAPSYTQEQHALGMALLLEVAQNAPNTAKISDLISRGAALELRNAQDSTPLLLAARGGHEHIADMLMQAGADVNSRDTDGSTPLILATLAGSVKTVRHLCDKNADMKHINNQDRTALMWAAALGRREIAQMLTRRGADSEQQNSVGQTAYDIARLHENYSLAEILKAGAQQQKAATTAPAVTTSHTTKRAASYKDMLGKV
ncbi:MAG: ankyrin repeat domain-containing protein [Bdellovibrionales bacterium]|jgi:ankyrin repeat protein|nr:ankyrin repeat domain-containing protein [Bdellovibrionales bacterium]